MTRRGGAALALAAALFVALGSCDGGPESGELTLTLETAQTELGAVAFAVSAPEPNTVSGAEAACSGCTVHTVTVSEREIRGIVIGTVAAGPFLHVSVSNVKEPTSYTVRVLDAATGTFVPVKASDVLLKLPAK